MQNESPQPSPRPPPAPRPVHALVHRLSRTLLCAARYAWASPNTLIGLSLAGLAVLGGGRARVHGGVVEAHGGIATWLLRHATLLPGGAAAITFGHCVLGVDANALDFTRRHERVHVAQYERWGPLFLPAYLAASVAARLTGRSFYFDNRFEREAYGLGPPAPRTPPRPRRSDGKAPRPDGGASRPDGKPPRPECRPPRPPRSPPPPPGPDRRSP